ncbi:hypothetical protein Dimus_003252 [Dionaea muscipula]
MRKKKFKRILAGFKLKKKLRFRGNTLKNKAGNDEDSESSDKFYDAMDDVSSVDEEIVAPTTPNVNDLTVSDKVVPTPADPMTAPAVPTASPASPADSTTVKTKGQKQTTGVKPSGSLPNRGGGHLLIGASIGHKMTFDDFMAENHDAATVAQRAQELHALTYAGLGTEEEEVVGQHLEEEEAKV